MQASNSVRSLATDSYNSAAKKFVTQNFKDCWELLQPLAQRSGEFVKKGEISANTRAKLWKLYAKLVEVADFDIELTWDTLLQGYDNLGEVEPDVMLAVSQELVKTEANIKATAKAIEENLSHKTRLSEAERPLVGFLVSVVLPSMGDFDYAREFASNCSVFDAKTKADLERSITSREHEIAESHRRKEQERLALELREKERVQKAIAAAAEAGEEEILEPEPIRDHPRHIERRAARTPQSLPEYWKQWILNAVKSRTLTNGFLFIIFLLTLASNLRFRRRVAAGGQWIWQGLKQTARMGMTVTYF